MENQLSKSKSPYLLQHAGNPVKWQPWSDQIFELAKKEDKMILISIGYAACHWCHVMEKESFTDEKIARLMNEHFIPVKIDREERPDVDQIYMNAVQIIGGQGGWPLTCFALPDGSPFFAGTYYPPKQFEGILQSLAAAWKNDRQTITNAAGQVKNGLLKTDIIRAGEQQQRKNPDEDFLHGYVSGWEYQFDSYWGGNSGAPKFPLPASLQFLLDYGILFKNNTITEHVRLTLDRMIRGGIYDQVGGGFARYTTDKKWRIPHFEKMLYDNGQMLKLISDFYRFENNTRIAETIRITVEFLKNEMQAPNKGFYSSYDADSEGEEGKYYVWKKQEIKDLLQNDAPLFIDYFNITDAGNWEDGKNILFSEKPLQAVCKKHKVNFEEGKEIISRSLHTLKQARNSRTKPGLDNKQLVSWNALVIEGLVAAYQALNAKEYLQMAVDAAEFLEKEAWQQNRLYRNCRKDEHAIPAFLDDYALAIRALQQLYMATSQEKWLTTARALIQYTIDHFMDSDTFLFFQTEEKDAPLGMRKMELMDNVIPSANSVMAENLFRFAVFDENDDYSTKALTMLQNMRPKLQHNGPFFANWMKVWMWFARPPFEMAVTGPKAAQKISEFHRHYIPGVISVWSEKPSELPLLKNRVHDQKTRMFICMGKTCQEPVESIEEAMKLLQP